MSAYEDLRLSVTEKRQWEEQAPQLVSEPVVRVVPVIRKSSGNFYALIFTSSSIVMFAVDAQLRLPTKPTLASIHGREVRDFAVAGAIVSLNGYSFIHYDEEKARDTASLISELRERSSAVGSSHQERSGAPKIAAPNNTGTTLMGDQGSQGWSSGDTPKSTARNPGRTLVQLGVALLLAAAAGVIWANMSRVSHDGAADLTEADRVAVSSADQPTVATSTSPFTRAPISPSPEYNAPQLGRGCIRADCD